MLNSSNIKRAKAARTMAWRRSNVWTLVSLGALVELQAYPSSATTAGGDPFLNTPGIQLAQPSETPTAPRVTKATDLCGKNCAQVVATILSVSECSSYIWSGGCPNVAPLTGFTNSSTLAELCPLECGLASMAHDNRRLQATTTGCTGSFYEDASSSSNGRERPPAGTACIDGCVDSSGSWGSDYCWTEPSGASSRQWGAPCASCTQASCNAYMDTIGCAWSLSFNCPGQSAGSQGPASVDGSQGYDCCCSQGLWIAWLALAAGNPAYAEELAAYSLERKPHDAGYDARNSSSKTAAGQAGDWCLDKRRIMDPNSYDIRNLGVS